VGESEIPYKGLFIVITFTQEELKTVGEVKANSLILGDCLQVMPYIASGSVDAILTDLPYG